MLIGILIGALLGLVVFALACLFDDTPNNKYARIAGIVVFVAYVLIYVLGFSK